MAVETRRNWLIAAASAGLLLAGSCKESADKDEISPTEDLMREHGVLNRILLIYEEGARRLETGAEFPVTVLASGADIIRRFIEQYHEKLEEERLFPRFEQANKLTDLVRTLREQHQAGHRLTDNILKLAGARPAEDAGRRAELVDTMRQYVRMYRPHEAREDTILFPTLRTLITEKELAQIGEDFEDREHDLFGKNGFEGVVGQVEKLERALGTYDLGQFTPRS
jgi:hemerythrin-like domain-containing protein